MSGKAFTSRSWPSAIACLCRFYPDAAAPARAGYYKKTIAATIGELVRRPDLRRLKMVGYNHGTRVSCNYTGGQRYARRNSSSPMQ
jgi:hypothetical protein